MTNYNQLFKQQMSNVYLQCNKNHSLPEGILNVPNKHYIVECKQFNLGRINGYKSLKKQGINDSMPKPKGRPSMKFNFPKNAT